MNIKDSLSVLNLLTLENITLDDVKTAYRKACSKYHPDRNPAGAEIMKMVNVAYSFLCDFLKNSEMKNDYFTNVEDAEDYGEEVNAALNAIINLQGLIIEICGYWVWVSGETRTHKDALKANGYRFAPKKTAWYFRTKDFKSSGRGKYSMDDIRSKYGSKGAYSTQKSLN